MPQYVIKLKDGPEDWHLAPIRGHSQVHKIFPFYPVDLAALEAHGVITVSQILETHLSRGMEKSVTPNLMTLLLLCPSTQTEILHAGISPKTISE